MAVTVVLKPDDWGVVGITSLELEDFPMTVCLVCCRPHSSGYLNFHLFAVLAPHQYYQERVN